MAKQKNNVISETAFNELIFRWFAPEFLRFERGWMWFTLLFGLNGLLVVYAYATEALTMMAVFILLPFVLLLEHRRKPKQVEMIVSPYGIKFGVLKLPYSNIRAFWIIHHPPHLDEIHLLVNKKTHSELVIPLMGVNPAVLRQYLLTQIPEWEGKQLSLMDTLIRVLRLN